MVKETARQVYEANGPKRGFTIQLNGGQQPQLCLVKRERKQAARSQNQQQQQHLLRDVLYGLIVFCR